MERNEIKEKLRLQWITDGNDPRTLVRQAERFLRGGGRWVQLRMKEADLPTVVRTARELSTLCRRYGAVLIVNDSPQAARLAEADGVHLGKHDGSPREARTLLGPGKIIGCTANTFEEIRRLAECPVDYIGLGPFRFTSTKKNLSPVLGPEGYERILRRMAEEKIDLPVVAIGGIAPEDIPSLSEGGVRYFAAAGAIGRADDPQAATRRFLTEIKKYEI